MSDVEQTDQAGSSAESWAAEIRLDAILPEHMTKAQIVALAKAAFTEGYQHHEALSQEQSDQPRRLDWVLSLFGLGRS